MSVWILCLLAFLLFLIVFGYIIYKIVTAPPTPDYVCNGNNPPPGIFQISNSSVNAGTPIFASNTPSLNGFYNLTFGTLHRSSFTFTDSQIVLSGTDLVWTRIIPGTVGYAMLSTRKEGLETQLWNISDGRITSPDGKYIVVIASVSGAYVPQVILQTNLDTNINKSSSCNFRFANAESS